jgi:hypothetical protein
MILISGYVILFFLVIFGILSYILQGIYNIIAHYSQYTHLINNICLKSYIDKEVPQSLELETSDGKKHKLNLKSSILGNYNYKTGNYHYIYTGNFILYKSENLSIKLSELKIQLLDFKYLRNYFECNLEIQLDNNSLFTTKHKDKDGVSVFQTPFDGFLLNERLIIDKPDIQSKINESKLNFFDILNLSIVIVIGVLLLNGQLYNYYNQLILQVQENNINLENFPPWEIIFIELSMRFPKFLGFLLVLILVLGGYIYLLYELFQLFKRKPYWRSEYIITSKIGIMSSIEDLSISKIEFQTDQYIEMVDIPEVSSNIRYGNKFIRTIDTKKIKLYPNFLMKFISNKNEIQSIKSKFKIHSNIFKNNSILIIKFNLED